MSKKRSLTSVNADALVEALQQHILGQREMTTTQVSAALALLKRIMPLAETAMAEHEDALQELE